MKGRGWPGRGLRVRREKGTGGTGAACRGNGNRLQVTGSSLGYRGLSFVVPVRTVGLSVV